MRRGVFGLCLSIGLMTVGCTSSIEAVCEKSKECDLIGSKTVDQCAADLNAERDKYVADEDCHLIVEKFDALNACNAGLSCSELKDKDNDVCERQESELLAAFFTVGADCKP